jgi:hypothetical protein
MKSPVNPWELSGKKLEAGIGIEPMIRVLQFFLACFCPFQPFSDFSHIDFAARNLCSKLPALESVEKT